MKSVIITGGLGYIGSHVAQAFHNVGYFPLIIDNGSNSKQVIPFGLTYNVDITSHGDVAQFMYDTRHYQPEGIIHLAAKIYVGESMREPDLYRRTNVLGTMEMVNAANQYKIRKFVNISSAAVYDDSPDTKEESQDLNNAKPSSVYGRTKLEAESIMAKSGLDYINLRYFNVAGCDPVNRVGDARYPSSHLIPSIVDSILLGKKFYLNGTRYETMDGTCVRDYSHVTDVAQQTLRAYQNIDTLKGESYNVCTGRGISNQQAVDIAMNEVSQFEVGLNEGRPGDGAILVGNPWKLKKLLQYRDKYDSIGTMIQTTLEYRRANYQRIYNV